MSHQENIRVTVVTEEHTWSSQISLKTIHYSFNFNLYGHCYEKMNRYYMCYIGVQIIFLHPRRPE